VSCDREEEEGRLKQRAKGIRFCAGIRRALCTDHLTKTRSLIRVSHRQQPLPVITDLYNGKAGGKASKEGLKVRLKS